MTKEECQEKIAEVVCNKPKQITCDDCYLLSKGKICDNFEHCRISEKTKEQLEYVMMPKNEHVFLKACAGSGKTEVVGLKTAYEMKQWKSYNRGIAVLTFTNDATDVIAERVKQFTGKGRTYPHYIGTLSSFIHSYIVQPFAYKNWGFEGRNEDFSYHIVDRNLSLYANNWLERYKCKIGYFTNEDKWLPILAHKIGYDMEKKDFYFYVGENRMLWLCEYYKSQSLQKHIQKVREEKGSGCWKFEYVKKCFEDCKKEFWKAGIATFDDLNCLAEKVLATNAGARIAERFPIIFIDECQDLSGNELKVVDALKKWGCTIHCIGDLNQSIYEFKRVDPKEIETYIQNYKHRELNTNFRSCKEIVDFTSKLISNADIQSTKAQSKIGLNALVYIEYDVPADAVRTYTTLLKTFKFLDKENRILVRQSLLRRELENLTCDGLDKKEQLIVALQLWQKGLPEQMGRALELAGWQISKWMGGSSEKRNYYCPKEITSVFSWRLFLMNVLNEMLHSDNLSDFKKTYGQWHIKARNELGKILQNNYPLIMEYDETKYRDFNNMVNGNNFKVSSGNGKVVIKEFEEGVSNTIPVMTIHSSKGCTFDTTLVISSMDAHSIGGHWKNHWINGSGEAKRMGYVASTRAKELLVWGVPKLSREDKELLESYGFVDAEKLLGNK